MDPPAIRNLQPVGTLQTILWNLFAVLLVCAAGVFGWWISVQPDQHHHRSEDGRGAQSEILRFNVLGQVFGYLCAILYLGSRLPQMLLNYRRKSTEGVSMLFFIFACIGNLTYVLSIFAFSPHCQVLGHCRPREGGALYGQYILVNLSWLLGSFGTLLLDFAIFVQFFIYRSAETGAMGIISDRSSIQDS